MYFSILIISIIIYNIVWRWKNRKVYKLSSQLKNKLLCLPLVGHAYLLMGNEERMRAIQRIGRISFESGGLTGIWLGPRFIVQVADPKTLEVLMKTCLEKDSITNVLRDLFGNGSIYAPVPIWRLRRKVIAPIFSTKNLNQFSEVFSKQSLEMVDQLKEVAGKGTFPLWKYLTTYSMNSICETTLGTKVDARQHLHQAFLDAFHQFSQKSTFLMCMPPIMQQMYKYLPAYTLYKKYIYHLWGFVDKIIINKREEIKKKDDTPIKQQSVKDKERKTFMELFIESSGGASGFTNLELREETLVLLIAGTDTSAVGAAFTCLMLARHPEVQEKVFTEIQNIFGDSKRPVTSEDLPQLKYLKAVIKESLRLYPPAPIILRNTKKEVIMLPNGMELPEHTSILINIWAVHRNPEYWGADAEKFRPERFLEQEQRHPAAFMPFSYGPRSCSGYRYAMMSMQTSVAMLVRNFRLSTDGDLMQAPLRVQFDIMMKHVDNFELKLEARSRFNNQTLNN